MWYSRVLELVADALRACDPGQLACEGEQASRRVIRGMFGLAERARLARSRAGP